jgi:hypothetical protein
MWVRRAYYSPKEVVKMNVPYTHPEPVTPVDQEDSLCGTCNGSGEGTHSDSTCGSCKGSGVEHDDSGYEDYMAEKADYLNDLARDERLVP